jgi:hypothetical protein
MIVTPRHPFTRVFAILIVLLLLGSGCRPDEASSTPEDPITVVPTATAVPPTRTRFPTMTPELIHSPTLDWGAVTVLPLRTPEPQPEASPEASVEPPRQVPREIPDPLTEADLDLLVPDRGPFHVTEAEISLGRVVLPVDLTSVAETGAFSVWSIPVGGYPDWRFLAFDLPLPADGELGPVVRAPISGQVWEGTRQMVNNEIVQVITIDHTLAEDQLLRATFTYTGTIEPLFVTRQQVEAGDVLFRLTRDTGRLRMLGNTRIRTGATLTLDAVIDQVNQQPSGIEELIFLRGVSLSPGGFLRDDDGFVISPVN